MARTVAIGIQDFETLVQEDLDAMNEYMDKVALSMFSFF